MRRCIIAPAIIGGLLISVQLAFGLSRSIGRDIEFPKGYDPKKAKAILEVVRDKQFDFKEGIVSYWPPDWATRLSFSGDADSLNRFLAALTRIEGVGLRVVLFRGRDDEGRRDTPWQLDFSHARPDQLTVYINLNAPNLDAAKLKLPEWPPPSPKRP